MKKNEMKSIGMFDSGVGGLSVMRQVTRALPNEHIVYFGDTARLPYGSKSREAIIRYSIENVVFLMEQEIKILIVACNTASAHALDKLQNIFNIPIIGVIEPGAERAAQMTRTGNIAVLGTKGTISSGAYQREIQKFLPKATITPIACPLFVHLVEEGFAAHEAARLVVREYLKPLHNSKIDTLILGSTHYPLLRSVIEEELDHRVTIVDPALTCAEKVTTILKERQLNSKKPQQGPHKYFVSDDPQKFRQLGQEFLGMPLEHVEAAARV